MLGIKPKALMHTRQTFVHWAQPQSLGLKFETRISDAQFHLFPNACIFSMFFLIRFASILSQNHIHNFMWTLLIT